MKVFRFINWKGGGLLLRLQQPGGKIQALRGLPVAFDWQVRIRPGEVTAFWIPQITATRVLEALGESRAAIARNLLRATPIMRLAETHS